MFDKNSELYKKILDNAPVSIITIDKDGYITLANKYYENFSRTKESRGHNIFASKFFIRENLVDDYRKLLADGTPVSRENCYEINNKGEDKYLKIIAVPIRDKDGNIEGALSMAIDNTEAFLFRTELEKLNKNLEKIVGERTAELKEALDFKKKFMDDLSREWAVVLNVVDNNLKLVAGDLHGETKKEAYDEIAGETKRISVMLEDLNLLTDFYASGPKLNYRKIDLNRLISSVSESFKEAAERKNIQIEHKNGEALIEMTADKNKLEKLLLNLIGNAIKYNKNNGWVEILAEKEDAEIIIKVKDSGVGIAKDHLPHIFERFYRISNGGRLRGRGGSGLGLAICQWVAEAHGGKIDVKSTLGQGSLFTVTLPIIDKSSDNM